jgi:hypothetical protein
MDTGVLSGVIRPVRAVDHSLPSYAEVENERSYTSSPPVCLHIEAGTALTHLLNFLRHSSWPRKPIILAMSVKGHSRYSESLTICL